MIAVVGSGAWAVVLIDTELDDNSYTGMAPASPSVDRAESGSVCKWLATSNSPTSGTTGLLLRKASPCKTVPLISKSKKLLDPTNSVNPAMNPVWAAAGNGVVEAMLLLAPVIEVEMLEEGA